MLFAFSLTLAAGLSTGVGGLAALAAKRDNGRFLSVSLGFSAGVMIYVSLVEILYKSRTSLIEVFGAHRGGYAAIVAFFAGMFFIALLDKALAPLETGEPCAAHNGLMRTGVFTALAIAIHNFPEGLATFLSAMQQHSVAIPIAAAIAIHNIPEGIAVAVPIYQASGSKGRAFLYALLSGLAEPAGALIGYLLLMPIMGDAVFGVMFAAVAGIMVFISFDDLLPAAREFGDHRLSLYGLAAGMAVMAVSLVLFS